jgi:hypothetical protein
MIYLRNRKAKILLPTPRKREKKNNNEPCRTSAPQPEHACFPNRAPPSPDRAPCPNQSNSWSIIPYVTPMKNTKIPDPKEVIDLISSSFEDDETHKQLFL